MHWWSSLANCSFWGIDLIADLFASVVKPLPLVVLSKTF